MIYVISEVVMSGDGRGESWFLFEMSVKKSGTQIHNVNLSSLMLRLIDSKKKEKPEIILVKN